MEKFGLEDDTLVGLRLLLCFGADLSVIFAVLGGEKLEEEVGGLLEDDQSSLVCVRALETGSTNKQQVQFRRRLVF